MKPFCALLVIVSVVDFNLVFNAREMILYKFDKSEIGHQFLIFSWEPFFGISQMLAVLKVGVNSPFLKQQFAYLSSGILSIPQNLVMNAVFNPSKPGADLVQYLLV